MNFSLPPDHTASLLVSFSQRAKMLFVASWLASTGLKPRKDALQYAWYDDPPDATRSVVASMLAAGNNTPYWALVRKS